MDQQYLTIAEVANRLGLSPKSIRNKMSNGTFKLGVHFFRPPGTSVRFKWSAVVQWMETPQPEPASVELIPMPKRGRHTRQRERPSAFVWIDMATLEVSQQLQ